MMAKELKKGLGRGLSELFGDDIGLDSIDSIEIIAGIDSLFGVQMTGAAREHFQTIETLAKYVESHKGE